MVVNPNSDIILYSGMPLDDTYTDTLYFSSLSAQTSFFTAGNAYEKRRFAVNTYQRVNEGVFDAQCLADEIYDCNYLAFRNTNFGSKWFYAFIDRIEYINNGMARVFFTIDSLQTYLFDCELEECMVEREHAITDDAGDNLEAEPLSVAEYVYDFYDELVAGKTYYNDIYECDVCIMIVDVEAKAGDPVDGSLYGNIYSGATIWAYGGLLDTTLHTPAQVVGNINAKLEEYIEKPDSIVNMFISPHFITEGTVDGREIQGYWSGAYHKRTITWNKPSNFNTFTDYNGDTFTPVNNKIHTYPFSYCHVDNSNGGSLTLRFELFRNQTPTFTVYGSPLPPIQLTLAPRLYKGSNNAVTPLFTEKLVMDEYPLCSWNYDTYKAWMAQNSIPMLFNLGKSVAGGAMSGGGAGFAVGAVGGALDIAQSTYTASIQADQMRGNSFSGNANFANNYARFRIGRGRPTIQQARIIDNFFSMYGYATNRVKIPNRAVRPHYTYCKTKGAKVIGKCPADDLKKICSIYDNGVTWWRNANEVGDYSVNNAPV